MKTKIKFWPIFSGIILIAFFVVLVIKFSDLEEFYNVLKQGIWYYIFTLFLIEIIFLADQAIIFKELFKVYNVKTTIRKVSKVFLASNFTNLALPSVGIAGLTIFSQAGPEIFKVKRSQAMVINLLYYLINYGTFIILMVIGLIILLTLNKLQVYHFIATSLMLIFVFAGSSIFWIGYKNKNQLSKLLNLIAKFINFFGSKILKKEIITQENLINIQNEILYIISVYKKRKNIFSEPVIYSFLGHILQIFILYICFLAFGFEPKIYAVVVGYIFSVVFVMVSPTPSGIGIVEPIMAVTMSSFDIPIQTATISTLAFRGISFWFPFFIGFYASRKLKID